MRGGLALAISDLKHHEEEVRRLPKTESERQNTDPADMIATITNIGAVRMRLVEKIKNSQRRDGSSIGLPFMVSGALIRAPVAPYQVFFRIAPIGFLFQIPMGIPF